MSLHLVPGAYSQTIRPCAFGACRGGRPDRSGRSPGADTSHLEIPPGQFYVSAAQLAHRFGVGVKCVNEHKLQVGATPISNSANSKPRYYLPTEDAYMHGRTLTPVEKRRRPRTKRGSGGGAEGLIQLV
jgi:hypothetical protein